VGQPDGFTDFVTVQGRGLLRTAWLLTGDWPAAEDLVQTTFIKVWRHWERVRDTDDPAAYVRRILVNTHLKMLRRRWSGERPAAELPEGTDALDALEASDVRHSLRAALATLPPRQRAVVVLRYFSDLSEAQTAAELGCSVGTVKSQASRAMVTLRSHPALAGLLTVEANS
jgi:RNA polymerase sigma-70 factor (sigma-E family)